MLLCKKYEQYNMFNKHPSGSPNRRRIIMDGGGENERIMENFESTLEPRLSDLIWGEPRYDN